MRALMLCLWCPALALVMIGCGQSSDQSATRDSDLGAFFDNSTRRDPDENESKIAAYVGGCTAFFVANAANKALLISARHCFNGSVTTWCNNRSTVRDNFGRTGTCARVVAADANHDIAMFEANFAEYDTSRALQLASYDPSVGMRLKMIGYPADKYRQGKLTMTENCWVLATGFGTPHRGGSMNDRSSKHNCTTWGGNSGGPMFREDRPTAIGLPFTYDPSTYNVKNGNSLRTAAYVANMSDFVSKHLATLTQEGVIIDNTP